MKAQQLMFPLAIKYNGQEFETKALKCAYPGNETMYKIAIPSVISDITLCWIAKNEKMWNIVMGDSLVEGVKDALIAAIVKLEAIHLIYPQLVSSKLKSA